MTKATELLSLGQSIWYDNIRRELLESGELSALIQAGVMGVTSNPTIFEKAIAGHTDYDAQMRELVAEGKSVDEIYEALVLRDIQHAADLLQPVYEQTNGIDGYISLEVSPTLARNTEGTIHDARRLFQAVGRRNVMIKVPATPEGIPAIEQLISDGININVTLIFSLAAYEAVIEAYLKGLEALHASGGDLSQVASVASFFVSRVDSAIDPELEKRGNKELQGELAIANAKVAYALFQERFSDERWQTLAASGAQMQRPLWASTGTKNPAYSDTLYIDKLIGPHTVNTVPPATLDAFQDHGNVASTIEDGIDQARAKIAALAGLGIDFDAVTNKLLEDAVTAFSRSFESLMASIAEKRARLLLEVRGSSASLGQYQNAVNAALAAMDKENVVARLWAKDHTLWRNDPTEIANRLGWLDLPQSMAEAAVCINDLVKDVLAADYRTVLLLGMGGSSLAPEVFRKTFGGRTLDLVVVDSTDADFIANLTEKYPPAKTLYIVSTKSGGTVETFSFFSHFYNNALKALGPNEVGNHFMAITDPGSKLAEVAEQYHFRSIYLNDPNIGGRYSALSYFGLVPAGLVGVRVGDILESAQTMAAACGASIPAAGNPGAWLGAILGELAKAGRNKVTLIADSSLSSFGDWVEQLIAESTGKEGKGILPVVGEPVGAPSVYGHDRLFVQLAVSHDRLPNKAEVDALVKAGHPVVTIALDDNLANVGGQFLAWEIATALAGRILGIQPFDQPNVESAKVLARKMVAAFNETGSLPAQSARLTDVHNGDIHVYGHSVTGKSAPEALRNFLKQAKAGDYVALQAYVQPTDAAHKVLGAMQAHIRDRLQVATTVGFGPRFLHSTGQLHKGDAGNGLFVIFTSDAANTVSIPDEAGQGLTFNVLKLAQALGDMQALTDNNRRVIRFHLGRNVQNALQILSEALTGL